MDNRTFHLILFVIGISLGAIVSAYGEAPAPFFKKNVAKCFYCAEAAEIEKPIMDVSDQNKKPTDEKPAELPPGLDPKSPLPFQQLVRAYESGNVGETYKAAKAWVQYQDRILKRTSDLAAVVNKAKQEVEADAKMNSSEIIPVANIQNNSVTIKLAFFFDTTNPITENAAQMVQDFYKATLADPSIELFGVPAFENSVDELREFKTNNGISFPVQYNRQLENQFEATGSPMLLAFAEGAKEPCRLEGSITIEAVEELVSQCRRGIVKRSSP